MPGLPNPRPVAATLAVSAALLLAACGGSTAPSASGGSVAVASSASTSSAAPASPTAEKTPNGIESKSAQQILDAATTAAKAQSSVHMTAFSDQDSGFDFDLYVSRESGGYGSITVQGDTLQLVVTSDAVYVKADPAFWAKNVSQEAADVIGDKWVQGPVEGGRFGDVTAFADLDQVVDGLLTPTGEVTKGRTEDIDGQPAIGLDSGEGTMFVATTGEPLPIKVRQKDGAGEATFTDWSAPVTVPVPAPEDTVAEADLPAPSPSSS